MLTEHKIVEDCEEMIHNGESSVVMSDTVPKEDLERQKELITESVKMRDCRARFLNLTQCKDPELVLLTYELIAPPELGKDIDHPKYKYRKGDFSEVDIGVLFYMGNRVVASELDYFSDTLYYYARELADKYPSAEALFAEECEFYLGAPKEYWGDKCWDEVYDSLTWDKESKSYKYGNWELICLDI